MQPSLFRKQIYLPQDHGSWVFIFSPLLIGLAAGGTFTTASFYLVVAALAAFLIRQPITIAVKAWTGRRALSDLNAARFWILIYGLVLVAVLAGLVRLGYMFVLFLAVPGIPVFAWHLWLVGKREERRQVNVEIIATGVLALAAPAAYWVGLGRYDPAGWWLWILTWFQSAASIVYAYLRLEQRDLDHVPGQVELWQRGWRSFAYTTFNLTAAIVLGIVSILPPLVFLSYLLQWLETLWGIFHPAIKWKPTRIGIRQLIVSTLWTVLFMITWKLK